MKGIAFLMAKQNEIQGPILIIRIQFIFLELQGPVDNWCAGIKQYGHPIHLIDLATITHPNLWSGQSILFKRKVYESTLQSIDVMHILKC